MALAGIGISFFRDIALHTGTGGVTPPSLPDISIWSASGLRQDPHNSYNNDQTEHG